MVKKKRFLRTWLSIIFLLIIVGGAVIGYQFYQRIYKSNITVDGEEPSFLYIPTGTNYEEVCTSLVENGLNNLESFRWVASKMNYPNQVKAGRYRLHNNMSNIELVRLLRSGRQTPVKIIFNNIRLNTQLAAAVAPSIEADSASIITLLINNEYLQRFHLNSETVLTMFIPNTYEFFWNTSAEGFMDRMAKEHQRFWSEDRQNKAKELNMTQVQVSVLASIIEEETQMNSEKATMAGVYVNRLQRGMPLQADPTIRFAVGDFTIKRILNKHKEIDSPYNTYEHAGLPPGPICIPSIASIDAVLNYAKHDYLYFCAKEDLSGYHNFARTLQQHNLNAQAYQRALNRLQIYR